MNNTEKIVINIDKKKNILSIVVVSIMILVTVSLLYFISKINYSFSIDTSFFGFLILLFIKIILYFGIVIFTLAILEGLFLIKDKDPAAILDKI